MSVIDRSSTQETSAHAELVVERMWPTGHVLEIRIRSEAGKNWNPGNIQCGSIGK
jgi:hypothetical protein